MRPALSWFLPAGWPYWSDMQRLLWLREQKPSHYRDKLLHKYENYLPNLKRKLP